MTDVTGIDWLQKLAAATLTLPAASDAQALAESSAAVGVTPANLAALTGTTSQTGILALATAAQVLAGTDTAKAVTAAGVQGAINKMDTLVFAGKNLTGACTLAGVKAGDIVLTVTGIAVGTVGDQSAKFESIITVNDQIQQSSATDLSANLYIALIQRKS
jgi:hypothetical protein